MNTALLNKSNPNLPDYFGITINYLTGKSESLEVVSCIYYERLTNNKGHLTAEHYDSYEIWTKDDFMKIVPRASIESIDYDKNWSKIVALRNEENKGITNV